VNSDLITTYEAVRENLPELLAKLRKFNGTQEAFNNLRRSTPKSKVGVAARMIYLGKTSYGGLFRKNKAGRYNVAFGGNVYRPARLEEQLTALSEYLTGNDVELLNADWRELTAKARRGDLVYLDPPYEPTRRFSFTNYGGTGGKGPSLETLHAEVQCLVRKGVFVVMSNSIAPAVLEAFSEFEQHVVHRDSKLSLASPTGQEPQRAEVIIVARPSANNVRKGAKSWMREQVKVSGVEYTYVCTRKFRMTHGVAQELDASKKYDVYSYAASRGKVGYRVLHGEWLYQIKDYDKPTERLEQLWGGKVRSRDGSKRASPTLAKRAVRAQKLEPRQRSTKDEPNDGLLTALAALVKLSRVPVDHLLRKTMVDIATANGVHLARIV
jgi:DNA adenine methylase